MAGGLSNAEVTEIYRAFGHLVYRRCRIVLRNQALADDALQEVFVKVMRYGGELRSADSKTRWLYRVADRCCFDLLRKQKRSPDGEASGDEAGRHPSVDIEARNAVLSLLALLDDSERTIAVLAFVDGMSQGDIATETGWSRQTINKKLGKIRERAGVHLGAHYG